MKGGGERNTECARGAEQRFRLKIMLRLQQKYKKEVAPEMKKKLGLKNIMAVPKIKKVVVNCGFGGMVGGKTSSERKKIQEHIVGSLSLIAGQKPALRKARKSIASFKLRKGMPVGAQVTLRGKRMYEFLEKLIWLIIPRTRDFRGIPQARFSKEGTLTIGFRDYTSFPELRVEKEKGLFGLEVTIVTDAKNREESIELLKLMGFPIK